MLRLSLLGPSIVALRQQLRLLTIIFTALAVVPLTACSSTGSGSNGAGSNHTAGSVTYNNPGKGQSFALVSESMLVEMGIPGETPRERTLNFYSAPKTSPNVKVCTDDVLRGVVQLFESQGFDKYAQEGSGDPNGQSLDGILQLRDNGAERYMLNSDDAQTHPGTKTTFTTLITLFIQVYGEVQQYQAVEGQVEFKQPVISDRVRSKMRNEDSGLFQGSIR